MLPSARQSLIDGLLDDLRRLLTLREEEISLGREAQLGKFFDFRSTGQDKKDVIAEEIAAMAAALETNRKDQEDRIAILMSLIYGGYDTFLPWGLSTSFEKVEEVLSSRRARARPSMPKRRGRPPKALEQTIEVMKAELASGQITEPALKELAIKQLPHRYGVDRKTAEQARNIVLGLRRQKPSRENAQNSVVQFLAGKS